MRWKVAVSAVALFATGCGAGPGSPATTGSVEAEPGSQASGPLSDEESEIVGTWENSSCGERQYRRRIDFLAGGRLDAVDEVAPCPPNAKCVWSGIIRWKGSWSLDGKEISVQIEPVESERVPELLPDGYLVLDDDPISIGEKTGEIICPYQKAQ